jgi:tripartite-type tricarboxylate transporter receptor subunit TctC
MNPQRRQFLHLAASSAALPALSRIATAQTYPTRPVRIIVGFAPGGAPDIVARLLAPSLSERLGQPIIVENRTGAGSNIATEAAVNAPPDFPPLSYVRGINQLASILDTSVADCRPRQRAPHHAGDRCTPETGRRGGWGNRA